MSSGALAVVLSGLVAIAVGTLGYLVVPGPSKVRATTAQSGQSLVVPVGTIAEPRRLGGGRERPATTSIVVRPTPPRAVPVPANAPVLPLGPSASAGAVLAPASAAQAHAPSVRLNSAVPAGIRRWEPLILGNASRHKLDPHLLAALMQVESNGREDAISPKNAIGLMQVLNGPADPEQNVAAGAAILAGHLETFGDLDLALAAYNAGPNAVRAHGGVPPYDETRWHVYLTRWWYWAFTKQ